MRLQWLAITGLPHISQRGSPASLSWRAARPVASRSTALTSGCCGSAGPSSLALKKDVPPAFGAPFSEEVRQKRLEPSRHAPERAGGGRPVGVRQETHPVAIARE